MVYDWNTCPSHIKEFVFVLKNRITEILNEDIEGFYLHGSLAMGGFNPKRSDIDVLVSTKGSIRIEDKRNLAQFFLDYSNSPHPIEISFLNTEQLNDWQHPSPFDFHYSESWRERYENELVLGTDQYINDDVKTDADLAAHITIMNHRGICVEGDPIDKVFPFIPEEDYVSSILTDYQECIENIEGDPVYSVLNLLRVLWYLKAGVISSKQEAGDWGVKTLPQELENTIKKAVASYNRKKENYSFEMVELVLLRNYISEKVQELLA